MAVRDNRHTGFVGLAPEFSQLLARNGLQANLLQDGDGYMLMVQGGGSPLMRYSLSSQQVKALSSWGSNSANKKAYNTFVSIVSNDFTVPRNFVSARSVGSPVNIGQHGAVVYDRLPYSRAAVPMYGYGPRGARMSFGGRMAGPPVVGGIGVGHIVYSRPDGSVAPGVLRAGGGGFYYKGEQQTSATQVDALQNLQAVVTPAVQQRITPEVIPYNDLIYSEQMSGDGYFTNERWQQVLSSHGIYVDEESKTLTIESDKYNMALTAPLEDEDLAILTANSLTDVKDAQGNVIEQGYSVEERLSIINDYIKNDFEGKITMDMLNSKERINLDVTPLALADIQAYQQAQQSSIASAQGVSRPDDMAYHTNFYEDENTAMVDGRSLSGINENKGWYREGKNGREVSVSEIRVEKILVPVEQPVQQQSSNGLISSVEDIKPAITDPNDTQQVEAAVVGQTLVFNQKTGDEREVVVASVEEVLPIDSQSEVYAGEGEDEEENLSDSTEKSYRLLDEHGTELVVVSASKIADLVNDGFSIDENKQVDLSLKQDYAPELRLSQPNVGQPNAAQQAGEAEAKYRMTAVINGQAITHEISQKQFDKFMAVDDYHRMKLFSDVFKEVDLKTRPEMRGQIGMKLFAALAAGVTVLGEAIRGPFGGGPPPEVYGAHYEAERPGRYSKPSVDAQDIASRNFEMAMAQGEGNNMGLGR